MATVNLSPRDIDIIARVVDTEVPRSLKTRSPAIYNQMVNAVVDTITNRVASPDFPNTVEKVVNQKRAFSKITGPKRLDPFGSVMAAPKAPSSLTSMVETHVMDRAKGANSTIGGATYYANPFYADQKNLNGWVNPMIEAGAKKFGVGRSVHFHGVPPGQQAAPVYDVTIDGKSFTPTPATRPEALTAPVSPVDRAPLGPVGSVPVSPVERQDLAPAEARPQQLDMTGAFADPGTPEQMAGIGINPASSFGVAGPVTDMGAGLNVMGTPSAKRADPNAALVQPLSPPVEVPTQKVFDLPSVEPQKQSWGVPTGTDFWTGKSNIGLTTAGTTMYRDEQGRQYSYSPKSNSVSRVMPDGTFVPEMGFMDPNKSLMGAVGFGKEGLSKKGGLKGIASTLAGAGLGAFAGGALAGPVGSKIGGALGGKIAQALAGGKNPIGQSKGVLGNLVSHMFGIDPLGSLEQQAKADVLASTGRKSFQGGSSNPSDYGYSPAAHDAIDRGQAGLF